MRPFTHVERLSSEPRRRRAIGALAAVLVVLLLVLIIGSFAVHRSAGDAQRGVLLNTAYQDAASGVAAEESLERKYRLQPGPVPLAGHTGAEQQVRRALGQVVALGNAQDRRLVARVLAEHGQYVLGAAKLFAAVAHHESMAQIDQIDSGGVDPVFSEMQKQIYAAADSHERAALASVAATRRTSSVVLALAWIHRKAA